ncbi:MAG: cobalamin B12-binding domain-containing protein [Nitrospirae bacterium]|nr:cobalamin B12-binding domain-containing protein [Nitrospirota bacterium]
MKIHLIYPDWGHFPLVYRRYIQVMGPAIVASLTPPDIELVFTDERLEKIDFDQHYDLVAISLMTSQANRAYEIADRYRAKGVPVVLGGVHVSLMPEEAAEHADAVVIGEAENTWPDVIRDFRNDHLKKSYSCRNPAEEIPLPRWSIFDTSVYLPMNSLQVSRGCPVNCEICSVPQTYGTEFRMADTKKILRDVEKLDQCLFLINDNLHLAKRRVKSFFEGLSQTGKPWVGLAPLSIAEDPAYLDLLKSSNCWAMYIDLSPWISAGLNEKISASQIGKANMFLERIRERNIKIIASFVFGFDHDQKDVFGRTVQFAKSNSIEEAEFHILTPYPKTRLAERLEAEGRLLTRDFSKYSASSVVFTPANMTPEELYEGYSRAWKEFYPEDTHEMTDEGLVIKTYACFPMNKGDLDNYRGAKWVDSVRKKYATEASA